MEFSLLHDVTEAEGEANVEQASGSFIMSFGDDSIPGWTRNTEPSEAVREAEENESEHMASLRRMISCALCKAVLVKANCFPSCFHAFCDGCLDKILNDNHVTSHVSCPICSMPAARDDVTRDDPLMEKLIDMYGKLRNGRYPCAPCGGAANHRCVDCRQDFCDKCKQEHRQLPVCHDHRFTSCRERSPRQPIDLVTFCDKHPNKQVEFNCQTCERPMCSRCFILEHRQRECQPEEIEDANRRLEPIAERLMRLVSKQRARMDEAVQHNAQLATAIAENASEQKKQIQEVIDRLLVRIQDEGKNLMAKTETLINEQLKKIFEQKEEAEAHSARLLGMEEWTRRIMANTTGSARLIELQTKLLPELKSVTENPKELQVIEERFVQFAPSLQSNVLIPLVGAVLASGDPEPEVGEITQDGAASHALKITTVGSEEEEGEEDEFLESRSSTPSPDDDRIVTVSKVTNKMTKRLWSIQPFVTYSIPIPYTQLLRKDITSARSFYVNRFCYQFCVVNELLWLPCHLDDNIVVYDFDGEYVTTIVPEMMNGVRAIRPLDEGRFVVACANGLFVTDETFKNPDCIQRGSFADVSTDNERLFTLDCAQNRVTIFTKMPYGWFLTNFTIDGVAFDAYDRIRVKGDHVYVSSASDHTIAVTDIHGRLLHYFKTEGSDGPGKFKLPNLCGVSNDEELLVLDNFNSHLQVLDQQGQWHIWDSVKVDGPHDLVFQDEATMWVLCSHSVKRTQIHRFTLL